MSQIKDQSQQNAGDVGESHLIIRHPEGEPEKHPLKEGQRLRIGRELDNDVVLTDARASRYHAEARYRDGQVEIKDLGGANGTVIGTNRIEADKWEKVQKGQFVQLGTTRIYWEKKSSGQSTRVMPTIEKEALAASTAAAAASSKGKAAPRPPQPQPEQSSPLPWIVGVGAVVALLIIAAIFFFLLMGDGEETGPAVVVQPTTEETTEATVEGIEGGGDISAQTSDASPTDTPTPSGPQIPIPSINIVSTEVRPIMLGALPSQDQGLLLVNLRVQNVGNAPFTVSTNNFSLRTTDTGELFEEAGGATTEEGLRRLGAIDRFDNLNLTPGGSVAESLLFEIEADDYNFELVYEAPEVDDPVILSLGTVEADRELAMALGITPEATEELASSTTEALTAAEAVTPTPTLEPTPTATRPPLVPVPQVVSRSALVGTIAYPVFDGTTYNLYFGDVESGETQFYRDQASQPSFSKDGSRIAFRSWRGDSRGLVTMDVSGANTTLVANFVEDQLPTWTPDGEEILFLSRRSGDRKSQLIRSDASTELDPGVIVGEGEYPTISPNGQLAFKGWGTTAYGLRVSDLTMGNIETVTNADEDTAPILSPDGSQIAFMSRREGNWDIYVANADGSDLRQLTTDEADDGLPTWSPDGNAIAFVSTRGGPWAIWVMTPDGDGKSQLFTMEGSPDGVIGPDSNASRGWAEERISWTR